MIQGIASNLVMQPTDYYYKTKRLSSLFVGCLLLVVFVSIKLSTGDQKISASPSSLEKTELLTWIFGALVVLYLFQFFLGLGRAVVERCKPVAFIASFLRHYLDWNYFLVLLYRPYLNHYRSISLLSGSLGPIVLVTIVNGLSSLIVAFLTLRASTGWVDY